MSEPLIPPSDNLEILSPQEKENLRRKMIKENVHTAIWVVLFVATIMFFKLSGVSLLPNLNNAAQKIENLGQVEMIRMGNTICVTPKFEGIATKVEACWEVRDGQVILK